MLTDTLLTLPPPAVTTAELTHLAATHFGVRGTLTPLTSERDLNHRLTTATGDSYTLKLSNQAEPAALTAFQTAALQHVAGKAPTPRVIPALNGQPIIATPHGALRLLTWLDGTPLHATPPSPEQRHAIGQALAKLTLALQDFTHPAADHTLLWDIKQTPRLAPLLPALNAPLRAEAATFLARFSTDIAPRLATLPSQIVHADFNPHNLLTAPDDATRITGVLDFGDMVRTPRACDLAVAASYQIDPADPLGSLAPLIQGYHAILPLRPEETALLYDLITARMFATLIITAWRAARYPANAAYILRNAASARAGLAAFAALDPANVSAQFAAAFESPPR